MAEGQRINWAQLLEVAGHVLLFVLGAYEVLIRVFPTAKDWTILGNIIKVLSRISDWLNNTKREKYV